MADSVPEVLRSELLQLFEETFERHHGMYTDKGTSLFETLDGLDHSLASRVLPGLDESIAGHVFHLTFYVVVIQEYILDVRSGKTDWNESWVVKTVDGASWKALVAKLRAEYAKLVEFVRGVESWDNGDYTGGLLAILAHCAYHLGAIRQLTGIRTATA